ncbi:MAG: RibD family protein [Caldilineaceae bacterium]|nr:RibD family protein [Caldilineaceae bacterium]
MRHPKGPGSPFQLLFAMESAQEPSLPSSYRAIYPGDWQPPAVEGRPYVYTNFAQSRDGRISFNEPNMRDASHVTKAAPHDRWLMGLLRTRAHAIMVGDTTINLESGHLFSPDFICPFDGDALNDLRHSEGYSAQMLLVILSYKGEINFDEACFQRPDLHRIVIATTTEGAARIKDVRRPAAIDVLDLGERSADLHRLMQILYGDYGVRNLLCEGGARVFAGMLDAGLVDEEFVTWCPTFVGRNEEHPRPSYTEGVAWLPHTAPYSQPLTLHRADDYLYMRTRCRYQK